MKHIKCVSRSNPKEAALWQEIVCQVAHAMAQILQLMGGNEPLITYVDTKCNIPTPNPSGTSTT